MPFKNKSEIEFNFIWVGGGQMPEMQMRNFVTFLYENQDVQINVWVDNKQTHEVLSVHLQKMKNIFEAQCKKTISYKNLAFKQISSSVLQIPTEIEELIENTRQAKLWAGLSDIYRLFILSRNDQSPKAKHARFYVEADNFMREPLWNYFKDKSVAGLAQSHLGNRSLFMPQHIRPDMLFVDIHSDLGKNFAVQMRAHLCTLLLDPPIKNGFDLLITKAKQLGGLHENDVMGSYGMITQTVFRMQFMQADPSNVYGMQDVMIKLEDVRRFIGPACGAEGRSWVKAGIEEIAGGRVYLSIMLRMTEISDKSGKIVPLIKADMGLDSLAQTKTRPVVS